MTTRTAAAAVSQELSPFGLALGVSRAGTKYPVRGIPHFDILRGKVKSSETSAFTLQTVSVCSLYRAVRALVALLDRLGGRRLC